MLSVRHQCLEIPQSPPMSSKPACREKTKFICLEQVPRNSSSDVILEIIDKTTVEPLKMRLRPMLRLCLPRRTFRAPSHLARAESATAAWEFSGTHQLMSDADSHLFPSLRLIFFVCFGRLHENDPPEEVTLLDHVVQRGGFRIRFPLELECDRDCSGMRCRTCHCR